MATKPKNKKKPARVSAKPKAARVPAKKTAGLTGYLVIWRHTMDDIPVGLFSNKDAAIRAAETISFKAGYAVAKKFDIDCTTPVCFAVCAFKDGIATSFEIVSRKDDA